MKVKLMCSGSRQETSTERGMSYFTPDDMFTIRKPKLVLPHPNYSRIFFSMLSFSSSPFFYCTQLLVYILKHTALKNNNNNKLNGQCDALINTRWRWDGGKYWFCENTHLSPLAACSFSSYHYIPVSYFILTLQPERNNIKILVHLAQLGNFNALHLSL